MIGRDLSARFLVPPAFGLAPSPHGTTSLGTHATTSQARALMPTGPTSPLRRSLLLGAGAAALAPLLPAPAGAQTLRRGRLPLWIQWTRIVGNRKNRRSCISMRAFPYDGLVVALLWELGPPKVSEMITFPDPGALFAEPLFRLYEARPNTTPPTNITFLEDVSWHAGNRLRENVWTEPDPAIEAMWDAWEDRPGLQRTPLNTTMGNTVLLLQQTTDPLPKPDKDAPEDAPPLYLDTVDLHKDLPVSKAVTQMVASRSMIATLPLSPQDSLPPGLYDPQGTTFVRLVPQAEAIAPHAYLRALRLS